MNYQEFKIQFIEAVRKQMKVFGVTAELFTKEIRKNNGVILDGLVFEGETEITPIVYLNDMYNGYRSGESLEMLAIQVLKMIEHFMQAVNIESIKALEWKSIKDKIVMKVIGLNKNMQMLKSFPCRRIEDLLIVYSILIDSADEMIPSCIINNEMLQKFAVSENDLYQVALENTPKCLPIQIIDIFTEIFEFGGGLQLSETYDLEVKSCDFDCGPPMYALTNCEKVGGAATIFYPDVLEEISEMLGYNLFILPSSIHEVIIVPHLPDIKVTVAELKEMVTMINSNSVDPLEQLTDSVYYFDKDNSTFKRCDDGLCGIDGTSTYLN